MNPFVPIVAYGSPTLIAAAGGRAQERFIEFFTANIRNRNTRRAYAQAVSEFLAWCEDHRVPSITAVQPVHVAGYIEELTRERSAPTTRISARPPTNRVDTIGNRSRSAATSPTGTICFHSRPSSLPISARLAVVASRSSATSCPASCVA